MITIVIVDDEKLIRAGIAKMIRDSIQVPLEIFEAKNGKEALELVEKENPNVVITDIRMPIMDGVEMMKNLSQMEKEIKPALIVLSGFDDFVYAKAAIQNGAQAYILKPVDKKELISAVQQAISSSKSNEQKRNEQTLKSIVDEGRIESKTELEGVSFPDGFYCISLMGNHCKKIVETVFSSLEFYTLESKKDYECIVIPREAKLQLDSDISLNQLSIGVSTTSDNLSALRTLKHQSFCAMLQNFYSTSHEIQYYIEPEECDYSRIDELYEHCVTKLMIASVEEIVNSLENLFDFSHFPQENHPFVLDYLYRKICANLFTRYPSVTVNDVYLQLKRIMIENIWQFKTVNEWKIVVIDYFIYISQLLQRNNSNHPYIEEAIAYIKENFSKNINMTVVANQVSVNYTWFSETFKEHTGMNFNEYLKKLRIEEACRLLEKGCYKVYEISERCGFGDVKYFTKAFKEKMGVSPGEWGKLHGAE